MDGALPAVLFITLLFLVNYTNRAILGPLLVHMEKGLGLNHVQATSFLLFLSIGFSLGLLCSGFMTARIAPRKVMAFSAIGSGVMLLCIAQSSTLGSVRILFGLLGVVAGVYTPAAMAALGSLVKPKYWSRAVAIHEISPPLSFILSPLLAETLAVYSGWQSALTVVGCLSLLVGGMFLFAGKGGEQTTDRPSIGGITETLRWPIFWGFVWLFALAVGGEFAPYSVLQLSLTTEQGLNSTEASRLLSLSRIISPFTVLLGGWATNRFGAVRAILFFLGVHGIALMAMALPVSMIGRSGVFVAMSIQAMITAFVFPPLFAFLVGSFPAGRQALLLSLSLPIALYIGGGFIPFLLGFCGEYLSFALGYFILGAVCLVTIPVLYLCRKQ